MYTMKTFTISGTTEDLTVVVGLLAKGVAECLF